MGARGREEVSPRAGTSGDLSWPLARAAHQRAERLAVIDGARRLTYEQLSRRVGALGRGLADLGLKPQARVGFLGVNSLAHAECWLGVPAAGFVLVDLNFRLAEPELAFMADDSGIEVLIVEEAQLDVARALRANCPGLRELVLDAPAPCPNDCIAYEDLISGEPADRGSLGGDTLATISYTGGTTGRPKGVMLSHGNLLANARHNLIATGHSEHDRWLHVCPMFHVAGTSNVFAATWVAATQVILPRFEPHAVASAIEAEAVTHTVLVPTMLAVLLDTLEAAEAAPDLTSIRHIQYAASPISPALQRRVLARFDCDIAQFYGMTEAAPTVTHCTPEDHRRGLAGEQPYAARLASMGAPVVGVEAEIRSIDGERSPPGEVGEVWVRGPNVMLGYWNRPDATAAALTDGWYHTGDAAHADSDGYLYLVDRLKDMIITGGENVYSVEVEAALAEHDAVLEAAVFGIPHPVWGEAVHAAVTVAPESKISDAELIEHCRARIAGYKVPRSIEVRSEPLPKSGAGKVLKNVLREPYWSGQQRNVS